MKKKIIWSLVAALGIAIAALAPYAIGQYNDMLITKNIMEKGYAVWSIDKETAIAIGNESNPAITKAFKGKLAAAYTADTAKEYYQDTLEVTKDDPYPSDNSFDKVEVVIRWWEGSHQRGNRLTAKFFGYFETTRDGHTGHACESTFEVFMERTAEGKPWLISSYTEDDLYPCRG